MPQTDPVSSLVLAYETSIFHRHLRLGGLVCFVGLYGCGSTQPELPQLACNPTGISVRNPNKAPITDVRVSVNDDEYLLEDQLPPIEPGLTLEIGPMSLRNAKTRQPLGLPYINCNAVKKISVSFKHNGKAYSMSGD